MNVVLAQAYPFRIAAIEAIAAHAEYTGGSHLRTHAEAVATAAKLFGKAASAADWRSFSIALEVLALLADWSEAVHTAAVDADRFLRAARLRYRNFLADQANTAYGLAVVAALAPVEEDLNIDAVLSLRTEISALEMPVAIFGIEDRNPIDPNGTEETGVKPEQVAVAFLEFEIDGRAAETLHSLTAGQVHDLDLTIRVSRWPDGAERLVIAPISIEPTSTWDFPSFEFIRPDGSPPYVFQRQGRMALFAAQGFNARPFEFRYAAEFQPRLGREEPVVVAGQRTLRLDGTDTSRHPITGYSDLDARIIKVREIFRQEPLISEVDVRDLLALLAPIGNLMGQAVQDKRYPEPIDEAAFQSDFQAFLRAHSVIGSELEVQGHVVGGKVDLTFRGIRIELKSERTRRLVPEDCKKFAPQAAAYAAGSGRRIALLCVLDSSTKSQAPFPIADGLTVIPVETGTSPIYVVSCLLQGGLPRPSDLSR